MKTSISVILSLAFTVGQVQGARHKKQDILARLHQQTSPLFRFSDKTVDVGAEMTRRNITFSNECNEKLAKGTKTLDSLVKFLNSHFNVKIEIGVHEGKPCTTCGDCKPSINAANAIKSYLEKKGIKKERITASGYGMTIPIATEPGDQKTVMQNAQKNKRIVFKITYNKY